MIMIFCAYLDMVHKIKCSLHLACHCQNQIEMIGAMPITEAEVVLTGEAAQDQRLAFPSLFLVANGASSGPYGIWY